VITSPPIRFATADAEPNDRITPSSTVTPWNARESDAGRYG
jgi:hypothetical protein